MTNDEPPQGGNPVGTAGSDWDALDVLQARARAATAQRDASIAELRQVIDDPEVLAEFGIDLCRLEG
jgi:hypothetical protein